MAIYKIRNHYSGNYLDYQTESWTTLKAIPAQQVVVASSDNSKSQRWYIDNPSGNTYIRALLDVNFGITRYENSITHQCGITNISYYNIMSNSPYDPMIKLEYSSTGYCRIKHVGSNMYLTELNYPASAPYAAWGSLASSGETMNRQLWWVEPVNDHPKTTLIMPQNMNQYYTEYPEYFNEDGCFASCIADVFAFMGNTSYTIDQLIADGIITQSSARVLDYDCSYCELDVNYKQTISWSALKAEIDAGYPVIIEVKRTGRSDHYIVVYGYAGNPSGLSDFFVLDPANDDVPTYDLGEYNSANHNNAYEICSYITVIRQEE